MLRQLGPLLFMSPVLMALGCTFFSPGPTNRVVLKVNDVEVRADEYSYALAEKLKTFNSLSAKDVGVVTQAKAAVTHDFIVRVLIQEWATQNGIFVRKEDLDAEVNKIRSDYPDDASFRQSLAQAGLSYEKWLETLRFNVLERLVLEKIRNDLPEVTAADIQKHYNEKKLSYSQSAASRLRQIVLGTEDSAKKILDDLRRGRSFAELAQKFSKTPEAATGGDLGWIERGTLEVFDAALRLGVGQRSAVLKSPYGFHIIEVVARRPAKTLTLQEVEKKIKNTILLEREQAAYSKWIESLILKARVYKDEELIKQIRVQTRG